MNSILYWRSTTLGKSQKRVTKHAKQGSSEREAFVELILSFLMFAYHSLQCMLWKQIIHNDDIAYYLEFGCIPELKSNFNVWKCEHNGIIIYSLWSSKSKWRNHINYIKQKLWRVSLLLPKRPEHLVLLYLMKFCLIGLVG